MFRWTSRSSVQENRAKERSENEKATRDWPERRLPHFGVVLRGKEYVEGVAKPRLGKRKSYFWGGSWKVEGARVSGLVECQGAGSDLPSALHSYQRQPKQSQESVECCDGVFGGLGSVRKAFWSTVGARRFLGTASAKSTCQPSTSTVASQRGITAQPTWITHCLRAANRRGS